MFPPYFSPNLYTTPPYFALEPWASTIGAEPFSSPLLKVSPTLSSPKKGSSTPLIAACGLLWGHLLWGHLLGADLLGERPLWGWLGLLCGGRLGSLRTEQATGLLWGWGSGFLLRPNGEQALLLRLGGRCGLLRSNGEQAAGLLGGGRLCGRGLLPEESRPHDERVRPSLPWGDARSGRGELLSQHADTVLSLSLSLSLYVVTSNVHKLRSCVALD